MVIAGVRSGDGGVVRGRLVPSEDAGATLQMVGTCSSGNRDSSGVSDLAHQCVNRRTPALVVIAGIRGSAMYSSVDMWRDQLATSKNVDRIRQVAVWRSFGNGNSGTGSDVVVPRVTDSRRQIALVVITGMGGCVGHDSLDTGRGRLATGANIGRTQ